MNYVPETDLASARDQMTLIHALKSELQRGIEMIAAIDDLSFRRAQNSTGSVGAQFRHNLDFVNCLLNAIDDGRIDFDRRQRNPLVEDNRAFAIERFREAIDRLSRLTPIELSKGMLVRSELNQTTWLPSSLIREVEFVHSHTVHHHALIAEKLAGYGIPVADNFGIARSTLKYWETKA